MGAVKKRAKGTKKVAVRGKAAAPSAAKLKAELAALKRENARLQTELAKLREAAIDELTVQWETLDGDAVRTLQYLSGCEHGHPEEIAKANRVNIQIVESYLGFLLRHAFVHRPATRGKAPYGIAEKGRRYLRERGLHR